MAALLSGPLLRTTAANFFFFLNFASFFLLPLRIRELGGSDTTVGAVMGIVGLASFSMLPFVGLTIDRYGRRLYLICGTIGMGLASLGFIFVDSVGVAMVALRALQGFSFAAAFTATTTFAADFAPRDRRAQALGTFGLSTILTHAIAPALGEEVIERAGFSTLFVAATVCTLIALFIAVSLPRGVVKRPATEVAGAGKLNSMQWAVAATTLLAGAGFGTVMTFIPTYVRGEELGRVGAFFLAYTSTAILVRLAGAGLSDTFGRRRVILPALAILGGSIAALSFVRSTAALVAVGALFGSAQGISYPTMHAFLVDVSVEGHFGRAQALFNGAFNLGVTGSAFTFGFIADHAGYRLMFRLAACTPLAAAALFYLLTGRLAASGPRGAPSIRG